MKAFVFSTKLIASIMVALLLISCSEDSEPVLEEIFEAVTLNLTGLNIVLDDTSFIVEDYNFKAFRATSYTPDSSGVLLAFGQDGESSYIELNLSNAKGLSKITSNVSDYSGNTKVSLWKAGQLIEEIPVPGGARDFDVVNDLGAREIDALRFTSLEGDVRTIRLE